jgi:O-antigen ligase
LQQGDSLSVALYSKYGTQYVPVGGATLSEADAKRGRVDIPLPDSLIRNISALSVTVHHCADTILSISSILLNRHVAVYPQDIMETLWWQDRLSFSLDTASNVVSSRMDKDGYGAFPVGIASFYQPRLVGFQLVLRVFLLAVFLLLLFLFYRLTFPRRFVIFAVALFLATLPLKIVYTNWAMGIIALIMIVTFIRCKPRTFKWQPIFIMLCATYLINVICLLYTDDLYLGVKRLDSNIPLIFFPVLFGIIQFSGKHVLLLLRFFVWVCIAFCGCSLLSYAAVIPDFDWDMALRDHKQYFPLLTMWPAHWQPSFDSTILLMAIPAVLFLRFQGKKHVSVVELCLGVLFPVLFTLLTGARVGIVIVPCLLGLAYLFYCKLKPVFKWGLMLAGIVVAVWCIHKFPQADEQFEDPIREDLRTLATDAIREKPLFGWGTGYVAPLIQAEETAQRLGREAPYPFNQFHNQYLETMVQFGIPGALLLLALIGWILYLAVRGKDYLLLSFITVYILFFWTETVLANSKGVVPFAFWLCFLMATQKNRLSSAEC